MGVKIHIPADQVWTFFYKNKKRFAEELVEIAANEETKYAVYLTEDDGYPMFSVCYGDDEPEYEEGAITQNDCTETAKRVFAKYLFPVTVTDGRMLTKADPMEPEDDEEYSEQYKLDEIYERDDELLLALCDFLQVVLEEGTEGAELFDTYGEDTINDILDHFLEYLADEHYFTMIRRPSFITDPETDEEYYTEYPYAYDPSPEEETSGKTHETTNNDGDTE